MHVDAPAGTRWPYQLYLGGVLALGAPLLVWGLFTTDPALVVPLVVSASLVEFLPARLRPGFAATLITFVILTGQLLDGTSAAVAACSGAFFFGSVRNSDRRWTRASFNAAQYAIAAFCSGFLFEAIANRPDGVDGIVTPKTLVLFALASLLLALVNIALVSGIVALDSGESFVGAAKSGALPGLLQVPYAALSVLSAILIREVGPEALVVMVVPALVARTGLLAFQRVDEAYEKLVRSFAKTIEIKDDYTRGHSERVSRLSDLVAGDLRVGYEDRRLVRYAAMLHDVGKIGVPLCVINKAGPLDDDEFEQMKQHPAIGENILRDIDFLLPVLDVVRHHHERLDGRGYPDGLTAQDLSQAVRIVTAVDAFDAMTSTRSYRRSMSVEEALAELHDGAGTQFDKEVVRAIEVVVRRIDWQPTMTFPGGIDSVPNITHVKPLAERHDFVPEGRQAASDVGAVG